MNKSIYAVAGNPILHSKSPLIFNTAFCEQRIQAHYTRILTRKAKDAIALATELNIKGLSITAPFKEEIIPYLNKLDNAAEHIESINTIKFDNGDKLGYNTDYLGVSNSLNLREPKKCLLLGAGGAAKAVCFGLKKQRHDITIVNRTQEKAMLLANKFQCTYGDLNQIEHLVKDSDVIVNTIPSGIRIINYQWLTKGQLVFDAIYKDSVYAAHAKKLGFKFISGETWLINQALPAFEIFTGEKTEFATMQTGLNPSMKKNIALIGFMGAGKSSIAKKLAKKLKVEYTDTDEQIEAATKKTIPELFAEIGEIQFREKENEILQHTCKDPTPILSCGGGSPIYPASSELLKKNYLIVYLHVSAQNALDRINKSPRPLLQENLNEQNIKKLHHQRLNLYLQSSDLIVDTNNKTIDDVVELLYEEINKTFDY